MSEIIGKQVTCNRCGHEIFLKLTFRETDHDAYEKLPEGWLYDGHFGDLCPQCAYDFKYFVSNFMNGKVTSAWRVTREEEA